MSNVYNHCTPLKQRHRSSEFLPYNPKLRTDMEFRVFCPPEDDRILAIGQKKWHTRSKFAFDPTGILESHLNRILDDIHFVHGYIRTIVEERGAELEELMLRQGFTFNFVWYEEEEKWSLVQLKSCGMRIGCSVCLSHLAEGWKGNVRKERGGE